MLPFKQMYNYHLFHFLFAPLASASNVFVCVCVCGREREENCMCVVYSQIVLQPVLVCFGVKCSHENIGFFVVVVVCVCVCVCV